MVQYPKNKTQTIVLFNNNTLPQGDILGYGLGSDTRRAEFNDAYQSCVLVHQNVCQLIDQQNFMEFYGYQRSFCYGHKCRPRFEPSAAWQPPN